jgi:23S rRNA (adenine2503-C2)-methyltransferase
MQNEKIDILSLFPEEIDISPAYRRKQVFGWLHKHAARSFGSMTNLSKAMRGELDGRFGIYAPEEAERQVSKDGTVKLLWRLWDGELVETVLMRYRHGRSACISTQAGCRQGCAFCASGAYGFSRDLTAGEMLSQILYCGDRVGNAVLMGMGEPLDNFENTVRFLRLVSHPEGYKLGLRNVALSTCGDVPGILKLAELGLPVTLSVSLHAPDDETRSRIMPINRKYPIGELMEACEKYFSKTARRISYEYAIIVGLNDTGEHAARLRALLRGRSAHVNIIPCNPVPGKPFFSPGGDAVKRFVSKLDGLQVTVRRTLGADIGGACGQLRAARRHSGERDIRRETC